MHIHDHTGHVGEVERELAELRELTLRFLSRKLGSKRKAEEKIRTAIFVKNLIDALYVRNIISDEESPPER